MLRLQKKYIINDLTKKMVFLTGPRQVGKTWLARDIAGNFSKSLYLNYDNTDDRSIITNRSWLDDVELIIFDEIHKMREWKNYLKGVYDTKPGHLKILVTGSARLETFRQSGDSLAGRFFRHRLLPISIVELENPDEASHDRLIRRGGFPEPFLAETDTDADRWRMQYFDGLIRTDVLDFENVHDLRAMQTLLEILRRRVGTPVSYASIAGDIDISPNTVKRYIRILESLYIIFPVTPYSKNIGRSLLKEPKIYFFDTGLVAGDEGARFENHMAVSLLKYVYAIEDYKGTYAELKYMRTKEKKEVDFCVTIGDSIDSIVEVKLSDREISKPLAYFCDTYGLKGFQVVKNLRNEYKEKSITVVKGLEYQKNLWPEQEVTINNSR